MFTWNFDFAALADKANETIRNTPVMLGTVAALLAVVAIICVVLRLSHEDTRGRPH